MELSLKKQKTSKEEDVSKVAKKEPERKAKEKEELQQFVELFDEVLHENKEDLSDEEIAEGVQDAIHYFRLAISGACDKEKLNTLKILCGFFHRYSPLYAGKTRRLIIDALQDCKELRSCFHQPSLKIVDIGSGAGGALVGLYSALYEKNFPFKSLELTVMDYNKKWKPFFDSIVLKLREDNFGNASKLFKEKDIKCSFVCFDMLNNDGCEMKKYLNEADIIFMKGFISALRDDSSRDKMMKNVASAMKPGSIVLYIESKSYARHFEKEEKNLSLVFCTKTENLTPPNSCLTTQVSDCSSEDTTSQSSESESEMLDTIIHSRTDLDNNFYFSVSGVSKYGRGFADHSNQEIYILVKKEKKIN